MASSTITIHDASSVLSCLQLVHALSPNGIVTIDFAQSQSTLVAVDSCCIVHITLDPNIVVVSESCSISLHISKWNSIVSAGAKTRKTLFLSTRENVVHALVSDGTEISADEDVDDSREQMDNVNALFASIQSSKEHRLALAVETTSTLMTHLAPFSDFKSVRITPLKTTETTTNVTIHGVEHTKTNGMRCSRTISSMRTLQHVTEDDCAILNTLTFSVQYLLKIIGAPTGKKCALRIAHSSMSEQYVLACRYVIEATAQKRKEGVEQVGTHRVSCIMSPIVEYDE